MASGIFFLPRTEKRPALSSTSKAAKKAVKNLASGALAVLTASCANDRQTKPIVIRSTSTTPIWSITQTRTCPIAPELTRLWPNSEENTICSSQGATDIGIPKT